MVNSQTKKQAWEVHIIFFNSHEMNKEQDDFDNSELLFDCKNVWISRRKD